MSAGAGINDPLSPDAIQDVVWFGVNRIGMTVIAVRQELSDEAT
jgi:hypothetical protein